MRRPNAHISPPSPSTPNPAQDFNLEPGRCVCVFPVTPRVQNRYGTLHGGCVATLVDVVSTVALLTVSPDPGVSVNIGCNYVTPCPCGTDVEVDARVTKVGRTLAFMDVTLRTAVGGKTVATGTHCKFLPNSRQTRSKL